MLAPELVLKIEKMLGKEGVLSHPAELMVYECDALTFHRRAPELVVFPKNATQVRDLVRLANEYGVPYVARGSGTGLSGGALPLEGGIVLEMARFNRIQEINVRGRYAVCEPGVLNLELTRQAQRYGLHFAPDPSSQASCTIAGNIANNAGGPHCLKYGNTVNHVLGLEVVTPQGELVRFGGPQGFSTGFNLTGLFVGSEGTLGILTGAWLRLLPEPQSVRTLFASFDHMKDATQSVSEIIASGILPAALEMMDQLAIQTVENSIYASGYPTAAAAVLLIELDGLEAETHSSALVIRRIIEKNRAVEIREAADDVERARLWAGRKGAFGAFGRIAKNLYLQDTVVPRTRLTEVLEKVYEIAHRYNLPLVNVFHAGDGNLHPVLPYDEDDPEDVRRVLAASEEMVKAAVDAGGTICGEHGVGLEKKDFMPYIFTDCDLEVMTRIRRLFDPTGLCNPGKLLPSTHMCSEFREKA
ncbi:MAG: FAD-binding protein [Acidobacteria bacterium]|nr:FAD-binding protein [Acidobacteriota bacterium]